VLPREPRPGQLAAQKRLYNRFDAIVVHSEHGRTRLVEELGVKPDRVHVIPHGVFTHLAEQTQLPPVPTPTPSQGGEPASNSVGDGDGYTRASSRATPQFVDNHSSDGRPVVLMFGLMRPYKGIEVLLDAWRGVQGEPPIENAQLWIAGMPKMDISTLQANAPANVRFDPRFITDEQLPFYFERATLVVLPYLQADQSGVLFTALAFGKPLLLSDVGGFPEIARTGAARVVGAGDAQALGRALRELLSNSAILAEMGARASDVKRGRYSWEAVARAHIELYTALSRQAPAR
jgi:glycosyltransferase involved in cell wall biosynthesis